MKKGRYIGLLISLLLSVWTASGVSFVSKDKNWLGGDDTFLTTEGNDFWLTFMNNNMINPDDPANKANPDFKFEMIIAVSARETVEIDVYLGSDKLGSFTANGGETTTYTVDKTKAEKAYLLESEQEGKYNGIHVVSSPITPENRKKTFSCFLYSRVGESGGSSRDASYVLPTRFLGKEYIVQTSPEDSYSTEFAIIATDDNTTVTIIPTFDTYGSKPAKTPFDITLNRGEAYLVASKQHAGTDDFNVDLSGSRICADKPISIFNGNQQMSLPIDEASTQDFAVEQALPLDKWGTEFHIALLDSTKLNKFRITAGFDGTQVDIYPYFSSVDQVYPESHNLNAGDSYLTTDAISLTDNIITEMVIRSNKPIMCYDYLTSAGDNPFTVGTGTSAFQVKLGDPANAMLPAWEHKVKDINFFTHELDPQKLSGKEPPQIYKVYVVTKTADKGKITLDGNAVSASEFKAFKSDASMSYASLSLSKSRYHTMSTTGEGFVGMVYALTHAQGYLHTLGFTPPNPQDTLYVANADEVVMSNASYDLEKVEGHGWYQRQWTEWLEGKEHLDTAIVCDSSYVKWAIEVPAEDPIKKIEWSVYNVTDGKKPSPANLDSVDVNTEPTGTTFSFDRKFILPEEEMEDRHQFFEYEIQAVLFRDRLLCTETDDIDTLKTTVRVTRVYNDTLFRVVCVGDTLNFFRDSLFNQDDLSKYVAGEKKPTRFAGVKKGKGDKYIEPWVYQLEVGKYDTLSRSYLSQAGCDSTMTLVVFVCDTFMHYDTIHLCTNQDTLYHGNTYYGRNYSDSTDITIRFYTESCDCQLDESIKKFRDKNGRTFNGCDSIYQLRIIPHQSYVIEKWDTVCLNPADSTGQYEWPVQYGTKKKIITEKDLVWSDTYGALFNTFRDTMYTKTCSECNGGAHGCDSIHVLHLMMPYSYHYEEKEEWCKLKYDPVKHDTVHNFFVWSGHYDENGNERVLTVSGDYYDNLKTKKYGCDSTYHLRLDYKAAAEKYYLTKDTVCFDSTAVFQWKTEKGVVMEEVPLNQDIPVSARCSTIYRYDDSRCDTVYALHLTIMPIYKITETHIMTQEEVYTWHVNGVTYGGEKATEPHNITVHQDSIITVHFNTTPIGTHSCDSVRILDLRVGSVYRDTTQGPDIYVCGQEKQYLWMGKDHEGKDSVRKVIPLSDLPDEGAYKWYTDEYKTYQGFDSIFYLYLYRAQSYIQTTEVEECQSRDINAKYTWVGHEGRDIYDQWGDKMPFIPLAYAGDYYYMDTMHTATYGCDSVCILHLHIYPYYDKYESAKVCQNEPFIWGETTIDTISTAHVGDYNYDLLYHSIYGCDSVIHVALRIDTVYKSPIEVTKRTMCDNDTIHFLGNVIYGAKSPLKPEDVDGVSVPGTARWFDFERKGNATSSNGCDSAVHHRIRLYRSYYFEESDHVCQGLEDFVWHEKKIDIRRCGTYVIYDSAFTEFDCDSVYQLTLRVDSNYYFHERLFMCDYDSITWQGKHYAGPKLRHPWPGYKVLKADTTYLDTVEIGTRYTGCDSTYFLALRVAPSYNDTITYNVCDNDSSDFAHVYEFRDKQGHYYRDSIEFNPTATHSGFVKPDVVIDTAHLLQTIEGCDSMVTYRILVHPTYHFIEADKGCAGYAIEWRGQYISGTGTYFVYDETENGCDSVFELDFYVKPFKTVPVYDHVCDNETYYHRDTVGATIFEEVVWHPGAPMPDTTKIPYIAVHFTGADGCDSIVYQYHLTVCSTYEYETDTNGICLGKPFEYTFVKGSGTVTHKWEGAAIEFDTDTFVQPFDTTFIDSLQTIWGCDSTFILNAHVFPSYRNIVYDTVCANDTFIWAARAPRQDSLIYDLQVGMHYLRDSFLTVDGCDSIYETRLTVNPYYFESDTLTLCADETLQWRDHFFEHMTPGNYYFEDDLKTHRGCDSIYHLYLTVIDTTREVNYDSICIGDTLFVGEHMYTVAGDYKDTVLNAAGCRHFIYTHLAVIPPTVPTIWAENVMCSNETAFELYYTYTNHYPVAYSVYFDSVGLSMGFEDMIDVPITSYTTPMAITVPIPYRDGNKSLFPRPDVYKVRLELDNGICRHKETDCIHDSTFMLSYPKWLTEQRFGDVIALLNETQNGGYTWSEYQWYENGTPLVGQTQPYLYIPTGLNPGSQYHVELTRDGEKQSFPTCPVEAYVNPIVNDFAPTKGYLSVAPTCIVVGNPIVNILSRKDGTYRITTTEGVMVSEGVFRADVTQVRVPATNGMYIVQLWSEDTPEEPYRAIKIFVKDKCETCDTSF